MKIEIQKLPVFGIEGWDHCWAPVIDGKVREWKGRPIRSLKKARGVAAAHLGVKVESLEFDVVTKGRQKPPPKRRKRRR